MMRLVGGHDRKHLIRALDGLGRAFRAFDAGLGILSQFFRAHRSVVRIGLDIEGDDLCGEGSL